MDNNVNWGKIEVVISVVNFKRVRSFLDLALTSTDSALRLLGFFSDVFVFPLPLPLPYSLLNDRLAVVTRFD